MNNNKRVKVSYWWTVLVAVFVGVCIGQIVFADPIQILSVKSIPLLTSVVVLILAVNTFYRRLKNKLAE